MNEDIPAATVLYRLTGVPFALTARFDSVKQAYVMPPRQLCNDPLHKRFSLGRAPMWQG